MFSGMIPSKQQYKRLSSYYVTPSDKLENNSTTEGLKESDTNTMQPLTPDNLSDTVSDNANGSRNWKTGTLVVLLLGTVVLVSSFYFMVNKSSKLNEGRKVVKENHDVLKAPPKEVQEVNLKEGDSELVFFVEDRERFTLEDLLRATADLRSEGFCSSLYKVKLENNDHYAVKRLKNLQVSLEEFGETLRKISNLKHQNILPLVGYRSTSEEKFIIYKYQNNGSLLNLLNGMFRLKIFISSNTLSITFSVFLNMYCMHKYVSALIILHNTC